MGILSGRRRSDPPVGEVFCDGGVQVILVGEFGYVNAYRYTEDGGGGGMSLRSRVFVCNGRGPLYDVDMVLLVELQFVGGRLKLCDLPRSSPSNYESAGTASGETASARVKQGIPSAQM